MRIGILGTRGIPNNYGGFEQLAEFLSVELVSRGHQVFVYNSSLHAYKNNMYKGVHIIHCYDPENKIGTAGQFIYDLNCVINSRQQNFDIVFQLGYTSSSVWFGWHKLANSVLITNMDGLEWKRNKYSALTKKFLAYAEKLAVKKSNYLIADSLGIKEYLQKKYNANSTYIAYGADVVINFNKEVLVKFNLEANSYYLIIARFEPENNIETIIKGYMESGSLLPLVIIGNANTLHGNMLLKKYKTSKLMFLGAVYNMQELNSLRHFSKIYFHGHSVGGTNPSLLEAMACNCMIAAHDNVFNKYVLTENALYFNTSNDVTLLINSIDKLKNREQLVADNNKNLLQNYNWQRIVDQYEELMKTAHAKRMAK